MALVFDLEEKTIGNLPTRSDVYVDFEDAKSDNFSKV
jgi:hypothetical protein